MSSDSLNKFFSNIFGSKKPNDDDQQFIKKESEQQENLEEKLEQEVEKIVDNIHHSGAILPEGYQQRNLDRENGGLEAEEKKEISSIDIWDDRSEQVDQMGSFNPYGNSAKKSMLWRNKKNKLDEKKHAATADAAEYNKSLKNSKSVNSQTPGQQNGFVSQVRNLRQDRSSSFDSFDKGNKGGGRGL